MNSLSTATAQARAHVAYSRELCANLPSLYAESRQLIARSRTLCMPYRRLRGASDLESPFIVEHIAKTAMCIECLSTKTGISVSQVTDGLTRLQSFMAVTVEMSRCEACLRVATVYRLAGGGGNGNGVAPAVVKPARPMLVTQSEAIWRHLETHRGQMFCTQCIAAALQATKRIDRAMLAAEGRGARRRYGTCATCGKERLLCGLLP